MKILPVEMIREADAYTISHEPIADIDLMERAAAACTAWLVENISPERKIKVIAGTGNNGGDGFAIGRMLREKGYAVSMILAGDPEKMSPSCRINYDRWGAGFTGTDTFFEPGDIVLDALFGSGLARPVEGQAAGIIRRVNESGATVVAVDIPSGLYCDSSVAGVKDPAIIHARYTLSFAPPKLAFFFAENYHYTGDLILLDIGISEEFIRQAAVKNHLVTESDILALLKGRQRFSHKGTFGHALLIAGSTGKMGAAVLAAGACIRSGPGLTTVRVPRSSISVLPVAVPEAMTVIDEDENLFTEVPDLAPFNAIAAGPGIGTSPETARALKLLIQEAGIPLVLDADALNILAENQTWLSFLPPGSILTPHPKEFERLAGKSSDHFDRNRLQREFAVRFNCYLVLKGAYTCIATPSGDCYFNPTGNPGMATGGSGDVLTGVLAGLMARGYTSLQSSLLGVYLHGLAGDLAALESGEESLVAGDITRHLGKALILLYGKL